MTQVLNGEAEEVRAPSLHDAPKLLVEWSSPWEEFRTAIGPAIRRSPRALAGEAPVGIFPYRGMVAGWILEALLIIAAVILPAKLASLRPSVSPAIPKYDVIYYSGDELPQTEDMGGARAGRTGRAGGREAYHRTQTIHVAREDSLRDKIVDAPKLDLPRSDSAVANLLAFKPIPGPAPTEGLRPSLRRPAINETAVAPTPQMQEQKFRQAPALYADVVAPAPEIRSDKLRSQLDLNTAVVPPSPSAPKRDPFVRNLPGSQAVAIVPPAVSAPEQITNLHPKLTLPASIVAPPPSQVTRDLRASGPGFGAGELQKQIVPPPVQVSGTSDRQVRSAFGNSATDVAPPPVQMNGMTSGSRTIAGSLQSDRVVPPPVQVGGGSTRGRRISGVGGGGAVVPPAPTLTADSSIGGLGRGSRGGGLGGPLDAGSVSAPPSNSGGSASGNGIVVSSQPGVKVGLPGNAGTGSLAMSPNGGSNPGAGGSGGTIGLGKGNGSGSGLSGEGSGAAKEGTGRGADTVARGGISPYPGTGGAGTGAVSKPPMPGVSVHGGSNIVTLPSFGGDGGGPNAAGHSTIAKNHEGPAITIVGSSRSGGALNLYGSDALRGDKTYTIYIDTALGTVVMEFADPASAAHPYAEDLIAPQPMRADLPANLKPSRLLIACVLDRSGILRNPRVLEPGNGELTAKVLASLPSWKFKPVFRGSQPIEVNAVLGFAIDTN